MACGMVGIFAAVIQRLEAQAGAVHMRVLWALVGRHLRKSMDELHVVSQGVRGRQCVSLRAMTVAGERRPLVEKLTEIFNDFSQVRDVFLDDPLSLRFAGSFARARLVVSCVLFRIRHHLSRFSLCRPPCVSLRDELNSRT